MGPLHKLSESDDLVIPADLKILLVDEAAIHAISVSLQHTRMLALEELEQSKSVKSLFKRTLTFIGKEPEAPKSETDLVKITAALKICEKMRGQLSRDVEQQTEIFLRESCEPYKRGLAAGTLNEDWQRAIRQFQETLRGYIRELGQSRNMASANYNHAADRVSENAMIAIEAARRIAADLVAHTCFVNEVVDRQHELVKGTPVADNYLPRLPLADYVVWTDMLVSKPLPEMQAHYDHILGLCETLVGPGIQELEQALLEFMVLNEKACASYVLSFIGTNRWKAMEEWFNPSAIHDLLQSIEKRYGMPPLPYTFELAEEPTTGDSTSPEPAATEPLALSRH